MLGPVDAQLILGIGEHLGVCGIALAPLAVVELLELFIQADPLVHTAELVRGHHAGPKVVLHRFLAAQLLNGAV